MSLSTGDVIEGKYRIVRLIGEGGMGAVYEGENVRIHRRVAIKVLHAGVAENADAVQRFEREAQAAGRIGSEHIVEVLDLGNLPNGDRFMVMEFMDGDALSDRIQARGRLTPEELYPIARQILEGLASAHGAGIIHRDLKPDNVFLLKSRGGQADFVKLLDFGISKFSALSGESGFSMTRTGAVMGTPYYMSPEQAKGAKGMDHRADLYAVGVILYEAVTGEVPFNADTFNELLFKIVLETPAPIEQLVPEIDPGFVQVVHKAMARDPALRYQTAGEFQEALDVWASGSGVAAAVPTHFGATPGGRAPMPSHLGNTPGPQAPQPGAGSMPGNTTGTPGAWANTGGTPYVEGGGSSKRKVGLIAAIAAGVLVLAGGGFAAVRMSADDSSEEAAAAEPQGPSLDEVKAAAAEEAKRIAEEARRQAQAELRKAEEKARLAEERATEVEEAAEKKKAEKEAREAREKAERLRAAARRAKAPKPKAKPKPKPAPKPAESPKKPDEVKRSGRRIRTEL